MPTLRHRSPTGTPCAACCNTAVICSTEKRFFTARLLARSGPIVPQSHPGNGLKKPEPLSGLWARLGDPMYEKIRNTALNIASFRFNRYRDKAYSEISLG